ERIAAARRAAEQQQRDEIALGQLRVARRLEGVFQRGWRAGERQRDVDALYARGDLESEIRFDAIRVREIDRAVLLETVAHPVEEHLPAFGDRRAPGQRRLRHRANRTQVAAQVQSA